MTVRIIEVVNVFGVWEIYKGKEVTFFKGFDTKRKALNYFKKKGYILID